MAAGQPVGSEFAEGHPVARDLFEAIKAGAEGYLLKDMSEADFSTTLAGIAKGEPALSGRLAARILGEFARQTARPVEPERPEGS